MTTTAVFVEILIIGLQALVWVGLVIAAIFGTAWIDLDRLEGWESFTTLVVFAGAYVLGVLVDRLADRAWTLHWYRSKTKEQGPKASEMRLTVMLRGGGMGTFLEYMRSRLRIARATVVNLLLAIPSGLAFAARAELPISWSVAFVIVANVLTLLAFYAAVNIQKAFDERLSQAYEILGRPSS